jgi:hypothetical protein
VTTQELFRARSNDLPTGALPVRTGGLLAGVRRPCPDHGGECCCVARSGEGQLIFWCENGTHHVTARS